jgi:MFS family permease
LSNLPETGAPLTRGELSRSTFRALKHRDYRLYMVGMLVSLTGTYMQTMAEGWLIYELSSSAFSLGLVGFITVVPLIPWQLVAGVLADRMSRRKLLAIAQTGMIFPPLLMAILAWTGVVQVWHIILLDLALNFFIMLAIPTRQAMAVDIVGPKDVDSAVSIASSILHLAVIVGPTVAGLLIPTVGVGWAFAINSLSFVLVLLIFRFIRAEQAPRAPGRATMRGQFAQGVRYILHEKVILALIAVIVLVNFCINPFQTLLPVYARDIFGVGATGLGLLNAAAGLGSIVGALGAAFLVSAFAGRRGTLMLTLTAAVAALMIGFAFSQNFVVACALLVLVAAGLTALKTSTFASVQLQARDELRGRVLSILVLIVGAAPRVGGFVAGIVASRSSAPISLGSLSIVCLLGVILIAIVWGSALQKVGVTGDAQNSG